MNQQPISPITGETLSALMDGEAGDFEVRRLLQQLAEEPELRATWSRYQLASALLHKQACYPVASVGLAESVQAAIASSDDVEPAKTGWHKHTARFAVAASVALAVVAGVQWQQRDMQSGEVVASVPAPAVAAPALRVDPPRHNAPGALLVSQPISVMAPLSTASSKPLAGQPLRFSEMPTAQGMAPLMPVARKNKR